MAKGATSKQAVLDKILEVFPNARQIDKEIRIPFMEDGAEVQIKVALTCAAKNVPLDGVVAEIAPATEVNPADGFAKVSMNPALTEPTKEEQKKISDLIARLGL